ncbi:MAG: trypsin-like peptidase domain-containing protein [Actinomycetota bacterium]
MRDPRAPSLPASGSDAFPEGLSGPAAPPYGSPETPTASPVGPGATDIVTDGAPAPADLGAPADDRSWAGPAAWSEPAPPPEVGAPAGSATSSAWIPVPPDPSAPAAPGAAPATELDGELVRRVVLLSAGVASVVALVVAGLVALLVLWLDDDEVAAPPGSAAPAAPGAADVGAVIEVVGDAVVGVRGGIGSDGSPGVGSGVIVDDEGLILTNDHVVGDGTGLTVVLADGSEVAADFVGSVPADDVALVRLRDPAMGSPAVLGSSADVQVGDAVVAVGEAVEPGGAPRATPGLVVATGRRIDDGVVRLDDLIQTDAAIGPGSSGGPLVDAAGAVVGINTTVAGTSPNVGLALPIDGVMTIVDQILAGEPVVEVPGFLGVQLLDVVDLADDQLASSDVRVDAGAFVAEVVEGTAAETAGVRVGDVIVSLDGEPVADDEAVTSRIAELEAGDLVVIELFRGEARLVVEATLGAREG